MASLARPVFNVIKFEVYKIAYISRSYIRPNMYIHLHNIVRGLHIHNIYKKEWKVPLHKLKSLPPEMFFFHGPLYMCTFVQSMHPIQNN